MKKILLFLTIAIVAFTEIHAQKLRARDLGIEIGVIPTGKWNAITDVTGVKVGHTTLNMGDSIRTGVTAIIPHDGNIFQSKIPAAMYIGNGFGKLIGISQVEELGNIETPILLTNTLNVSLVANALIDYMLDLPENKNVRSINPIVGETNDGYLNDIRGRHVSKEHAFNAIENADTGEVEEGNVGAGTGTVCFGFKGGIGTSSRKLPESLGGYTVGVLVQSNFGGVLQVDGAPVGEELEKYYFQDQLNESADGSCMMVIATDAPLDARNLKRLAKRAMLGLAKTGGIASNGSGDYVISFSTAEENRIPYQTEERVFTRKVLKNGAMSPLFMSVIEATEEAILNSLFQAETTTGRAGHTIEKLPIKQVKKILKKYGKI